MASDPDYGQNITESFANYDPDTCSWKTSPGFILQEVPKSSLILPRSGMMRNGTAYLLQRLVPRTSGIDSSLWRTPSAEQAGDNEEYLASLTDKNGNLMAFMTLEDIKGTVDCIVFSKIFKKFKENIESDGIVYLRGVTDRRNDKIQILVSEVLKIEEGRTKVAKSASNPSMHFHFDISSWPKH